MGDEVIDALGKLLDGYLIHIVHRDVPHGSVGFAHHFIMVPVVGRRGHDFVQVLGGLCSADAVDARHMHVLAVKHQVAGHTGGVEHFFLVLMACRFDAMCLGPLGQRLHESFGIECGSGAEELAAGGSRLFAQAVPKSWVEAVGSKAIHLLETLVEALRPHAPVAPISSRFVEESAGYRRAEGFGEMLVVLLVRIFDEKLHGIGIHIVHIRVARVDAAEYHNLPLAVTRGRRPYHFVIRDEGAQADRCLLHRAICSHSHHRARDGAEVQRVLLQGIGSALCLVESLDGHAGMIVPKARNTIAEGVAHAAARKTVLVVERHLYSLLPSHLHHSAIQAEILLAQIGRTEIAAIGQDGTTAVEVAVYHVPELVLHLSFLYRGVVPEPEGNGTPRFARLQELAAGIGSLGTSSQNCCKQDNKQGRFALE